MPTRSLPQNPSLDHLKQQAKTLLRQVRAGEPAARMLVVEFHPRAAAALTAFRLADAQLAVARQYGFASWPRLGAHLKVVVQYTRSPHRQLVGQPLSSPDALADELLRLACLTYGADSPTRLTGARELLAAHPDLSTANVYIMAALGEVAALADLLARAPHLANQPGGPFSWEPLLYLAYARIPDDPPRRSILAVARLLLDAGADPNAGYLWEGLPSPFTVLTGAFGGGEGGQNQPSHQHCQELARLLLAAGADPNDSQTLYNRHFSPDDAHLELLLAHGLGRGAGGPWHARLGSQLHAPAVLLQDQLVWAARLGYADRVCLLLQHGVDVDGRGSQHPVVHGGTAYETAIVSGHTEIAALLRASGADPGTLDAVQTFLGTCLSGDRTAVDRLLAADPGLLARSIAREPHAVIRAATTGRIAAVELLVALGFDVNAVGRASALHEAAWAGHLPMVRALLALGADATILDPTYHAPPLGWARHNQQHAVAALLEPLTGLVPGSPHAGEAAGG